MHVLLLGLQVPVRRAGDPCHPPEVPLRLCVDPLLRGRALKEGRKLGFLTSHCFVVFAIRISNLHPLGQSSVVRAVFARAGRHMCKHRRRISSGVPRDGARVRQINFRCVFNHSNKIYLKESVSCRDVCIGCNESEGFTIVQNRFPYSSFGYLI